MGKTALNSREIYVLVEPQASDQAFDENGSSTTWQHHRSIEDARLQLWYLT